MSEKDSNPQKNIKSAFSKVKEDILNLKNEIQTNKKLLLTQKEQIGALKEKIYEILLENKILKANQPLNLVMYPIISSGQSRTHALTHSTFDQFNKSLERKFLSLTKKEFLIFLTIYQLEEDLKQVTYFDIANHLKLTESCVRSYVSELIKKGLPVVKEKINNRQTIFKVSPDFKELKLKQKLLDLFYKKDPKQTTLVDI